MTEAADLTAILERIEAHVATLAAGEDPAPKPWLTLAEAAEYARCTKPDGRPRDRFYTAVRNHIGDRRLVQRDEIDDLLREGKL